MATLCSAAPKRVLSFDVGAGFPEILAAHAQIQAYERWQFGLGYTWVPSVGSLGSAIALPPQQVQLVDGNTYTLNPNVTPSFSAITPFVRYFPGQNNFYFQFSYMLLRANLQVRSGLTRLGLTTELEDALITGTVVFTQSLPTLSIGCIFGSELYFFNISLGVTWLGPVFTSASLNGALPDTVGGATGNEGALDAVEEELGDNASEVVAEIRHEYPFFPAIFFSFGLML